MISLWARVAVDRLSLYDWLLLFEHLWVRCYTKCFTCVAFYKLTIQDKNNLGCRMVWSQSALKVCSFIFGERKGREKRRQRGYLFLSNKRKPFLDSDWSDLGHVPMPYPITVYQENANCWLTKACTAESITGRENGVIMIGWDCGYCENGVTMIGPPLE